VPLRQTRCVVVDVETTGLDTRRDRLLSIGACGVEALRQRPGEGFEAIRRHHQASELNNIPIHGISPQPQAAGEAPETALMVFLGFIGKYPLVAFHASFNQAMLDRTLREALGGRLRNPWLDLAHPGPGAIPVACPSMSADQT